MRSPPISLTKEVIKSLRSTKVGGEEGVDIKAIAEADGPGDSAFIERLRGGMELISREYTRVCVSEGVIKRAGKTKCVLWPWRNRRGYFRTSNAIDGRQSTSEISDA